MNIIRYNRPESPSWTPFDRLFSLRDDLNRLFDSALPDFSGENGLFSGWTPALDVSQDKDHVFVKFELPGLKKEEIDISLHDRTLSISGERKRESKEKEGEAFRSERYFGKFQRSLTLPTAVDGQNVKAVYKDGVLAITLSKAEEAKPKQIEVNVS